MNLLLLSRIDEELDSSEVASLCFLCRDVLNRKRLETVRDGRGLFLKLQEKGLLENHHFLSHLLDTIGRVDLLNLLESDSSQPEMSPQTDAIPALSEYRRMLFQVSDDITQENLTKMKFLLGDKLARGRLEHCTTPLDVLAEMERQGLLSEERLEDLQGTLQECDSQLAWKIQQYRARTGSSVSQQESFVPPIRNRHLQPSPSPRVSIDQRTDCLPQSLQSLSISETQPSRVPSQTIEERQSLYSDSQPDSCPQDQMNNYVLTHNPRGVCFIINNHHFSGLRDRSGTEQDERAVREVFSRLGFEVTVHSDLTEAAMLAAVRELGGRSHAQADALVVCVLSHGEKGCVLGTDGGRVLLSSLTDPFTSGRCPSLAGKPKMFFIQACQGSELQKGSSLHASPRQGERTEEMRIEADDADDSVPYAADFLIGMATVEECKSFRNTRHGSIYIQELCKQLERGAASGENILSVLTHVNREVSRGVYDGNKQMPEPKYTLTKNLILSFL